MLRRAGAQPFPAMLRTGRGRARLRAILQVAVGAAVVGVLAARFGAGPFLTALTSLSLPLVLAAAAVTAASTLCAAYRWRQVTLGLGVPIGLGAAVRAYYGSQLVNATLPGGVLGDVHRGLVHGSGEYPLGRCLRAVAWERLLGQLVQVAVTAAVIVTWPSALRPPVAAGVGILAAVLLALALAVRAGRRPGVAAPGRQERARWGRRAWRGVTADWRGIADVPGARIRIALASAGALGGHVAVFLLAARGVDPTMPLLPLVPLTVVVLLVAALPLNVAGWGPREGAAAWVFAAAGLGAARGLSVSVVYALLSLIAVLPGVVVLLTRRRVVRHGR